MRDLLDSSQAKPAAYCKAKSSVDLTESRQSPSSFQQRRVHFRACAVLVSRKMWPSTLPETDERLWIALVSPLWRRESGNARSRLSMGDQRLWLRANQPVATVLGLLDVDTLRLRGSIARSRAGGLASMWSLRHSTMYFVTRCDADICTFLRLHASSTQRMHDCTVSRRRGSWWQWNPNSPHHSKSAPDAVPCRAQGTAMPRASCSGSASGSRRRPLSLNLAHAEIAIRGWMHIRSLMANPQSHLARQQQAWTFPPSRNSLVQKDQT